MTSIRSAARTQRLAALLPVSQIQSGVIGDRQLRTAGWTRHQVDHEIDVGRWTRVAPEVVALQNAPLIWEQRLWLGVLHAGSRSMLSHRTACQLHGLTGWEGGGLIDVLTVKSNTLERLAGFMFHETRREFDGWVHPSRRPRMLRLEEAALLTAERQRGVKAGIGVLAACVQQRLTTAPRLFTASTAIRKLRHGQHFRLSLWDIEGGSHSFAELDVVRRCRGAGLVPPTRQQIRCDATGRRRYLDLAWDLPDGRVLILEVDGSFHLKSESWWKDMRRERKIVVTGPTVIRCSTFEVRLDFPDIARDLVALGVPLITHQAA